jgi:hypothetical protein
MCPIGPGKVAEQHLHLVGEQIGERGALRDMAATACSSGEAADDSEFVGAR